jgi:hypothetical protein
MQIISTSRTTYILQHDDNSSAGSLTYSDDSLSEAILTCGKEYSITRQTNGIWITKETCTKILQAVCKVRIDGTITLNLDNKKNIFKKPLSWKLRFVLLNEEREEVMALLPSINWLKETYDFSLQINEEYTDECDSFIILQTLHCANCSSSMMNGDAVPAIVSTS